MRRPIRFSVLFLALAGCGEAAVPEQLSGLWSSGPAACEAGVGVRFADQAIEAVYDNRTETLFLRPRYTVEQDGRGVRIRIVYDLPTLPGGARSAGARGVVVLSQRRDGQIAPVSHQLIDGRTGAVRLRLQRDPASDLLRLRRCGPSVPLWEAGLRGRAPS